MALFRLSDGQIKRFLDAPETAMGLHITRTHGDKTVRDKTVSDHTVYVLGGLVLLVPDNTAWEQISELLRTRWLQPDSGLSEEEKEDQFEKWRRSLPESPRLRDPLIMRNRVAMLHLWSRKPLPKPPTPPTVIYGHLAFRQHTRITDVFYRYEPWPSSRRIDQVNKRIAAGTYGCPASEVAYAPTGFAAVGRFALPNLAPACFRWELQPKHRTTIHCGASVPLYGQAGGGVEVYFPNQTSNRGPIANPVVLPAL